MHPVVVAIFIGGTHLRDSLTALCTSSGNQNWRSSIGRRRCLPTYPSATWVQAIGNGE